MAFLTLHEMLPLAFDYAGQKQAVKAVFVGMACMSARYVDSSNYMLCFHRLFFSSRFSVLVFEHV
jgi:hypothetical protein